MIFDPTQTITKIEFQKKKKNRVNIFLDGKYAFPLNLESVFDFKLEKGKELSISEVKSLLLESELERVVAKIINFISYRPRSHKEIKDRAFQYTKDYSENRDFLLNKALEYLEKKNLINDHEFTLWFIEQRKLHKPRSLSQIRGELLGKGIEKKIINNALSELEFSELNSIKALYRKYKNRKDSKSMTQFLLRKGFKYENIKSVLNSSDNV